MVILESQYIWIVWDIIAVAIFAAFIGSSARKGFISSLISFSGYFIASAAAAMANTPLAKFLYDNIVRDALLHTLTRRLNQTFSSAGAGKADVLGAIPGILRRMMGSSAEQIAALSPDNVAENVADTILDVALRDPVMTLLKALCFLVLFTLASFFARSLARLFTGLNRVPLVGLVNTVLGGALGVLGGALAIYILAFILRLAVMFSGGKWWWLNNTVMDNTYIWRVFY